MTGVCDEIGHEWEPAGGGLLICALCEAEMWDGSTNDFEQRIREHYRDEEIDNGDAEEFLR